jgi:transposase
MPSHAHRREASDGNGSKASGSRTPTAASRPTRARTPFVLDNEQRATLAVELADPATRAGHARRIRVILLAAEGLRGVAIAERLELSVGQVSRIRRSFEDGGVAALRDRPHAGRRDHAVSLETAAQIATLAASPPPPGRARWSTRLIAAEVGLTSATVAKILRRTRAASASSPPA